RVTSDRDSGMGLPGEQSAALGTLVMGILTDQLSGAVARRTFAMVAASGIVLVATFGAFFALLSRRLRRMVRFAEQLAAGDLAAYLTDEAEDEVGRLAGALLELRDNTRAVVAEMRDAAVALESTSEEVFDGATRQLEHSRPGGQRGRNGADDGRPAGALRQGAEQCAGGARPGGVQRRQLPRGRRVDRARRPRRERAGRADRRERADAARPGGAHPSRRTGHRCG